MAMARDIGTRVLGAIDFEAMPAGQALLAHFLSDANERKIPLSCRLDTAF